MWLDEPVTEAELHQLDDFLASDAAPDGCMDISTLHGFLTAVAIGPGMVRPSEWLPVVWGDEESPEFESREEAERIFGVMMRLYNEILRTLRQSPDEFLPIIHEEETADAEPRPNPENWCLGFMMGVALRPDDWTPLFKKKYGATILFPIVALADEQMMVKELGPDARKELTRERLTEMIPSSVVSAYEHWLGRREPIDPNLAPSEPHAGRHAKVGRNDPCPCGSGKKYKKCCGAAKL
jgi:uncharacterized protein